MATFIKRMHPAAIIEHGPKRVLIERAHIFTDCDRNILYIFIVKSAREMMAVDKVVIIFWSEDDTGMQ